MIRHAEVSVGGSPADLAGGVRRTRVAYAESLATSGI